MEPIASLAKSAIKTLTLGEPLEADVNIYDLPKDLAHFIWSTGFPISMPRGFVQKARDFYDRVRLRVEQADVEQVSRKSFAEFKLDLDKVVDSIVDEVRRSPDGIYTDYLRTRVDGVPLEDACTALGLQLRAYGFDLTNYHKIAKTVLGIPLMPTVASTLMNLGQLADLNKVKDLSQSIPGSAQLSPATDFLTNLPDTAFNSVSHVSNTALGSIASVRDQLPLQNIVKATPLSPQFWHMSQPAPMPAAMGAPAVTAY